MTWWLWLLLGIVGGAVAILALVWFATRVAIARGLGW